MHLRLLILGLTGSAVFGLSSGAYAAEPLSAWRAALAVDPTVQVALAGRDAALENIGIARSRLLPQVTLQTTEQQLDQTTMGAFGPTRFEGRSRNSSLSARQALLRVRDRRGVDLGLAQAEHAEHKVRSAQAELWVRVMTAWLDVLGAQRMLAIHQGVLPTVRVAAQQERTRFERGDGTRDAVIEAEAQLVNAQAQVSDAKAELESRRKAFALLTRLPVEPFERYAFPAPQALPDMPLDIGGLTARVQDTNPEVLAARQVERMAELRLAQASADHLPTVDLIASATEAQNDSTNNLGTRYRNRQIGVQISIPIYQGGGVRASERQAIAGQASALAERLALEQRIQLQIDADWQSMLGARERATGVRGLVAASAEARKAVDIGVKHGMRTLGDATTAHLNQSRREMELTQLTVSYLKTQMRMLGFLPANDPTVERWAGALWGSVQAGASAPASR